ncbi:hypothetical protein ACVWYG_000259 [Pedobacter sp. UYEF25]
MLDPVFIDTKNKMISTFFTRQSNRTYFAFGVLTMLLAETAFIIGFSVNSKSPYILLLNLLALAIGSVNVYFYFNNLINQNLRLKEGIGGGITCISVIIPFLFCLSMLILN